uniref:Large ribosomal subunit protein eL24-related N-terminal domain-containing protein n=1 Tax=Lotharella oceanica TaxID=641309 RepID=A0A7S2TS79_9EUKA|mmetsp:Transcript_27676/g.51593  ORF Transcript_27676/g.51593 Transcript_27676/m.51593 type:complete len:158 (+) Transcript_27676:39-512(+)|eukprot:CAMPEP_0170167248 /NCGR_PEP_ID=MMETSP0040_2-20121228/708_1 /TAXON_ID=641309 /ORGANISM="Lotharella oceanica, Strain CCMP622" /LENGTH=157 /DNA_ID=CAMNT_0010405215 /DNA_START=32 /DNA_END=505 /DNA_ORIENTATION=+
MVVKTDLCYFTECKVFPGHGIRYVRKDGKLLTFLNSKAFSLHMQRKKAQRLRWTLVWRRKHKASSKKVIKKKKTKTVKVVRAIAGLSLDELKERMVSKTGGAKKSTTKKEATIKAVKARRRTAEERKKRSAGFSKSSRATKGFVKVPKSRMRMRTQR